MKKRFTLGALIGALALTGSARAAVPQTVFTEADAANGELANPFLDTVVTSGGTAYAVTRDLDSVGGVVTAFDGIGFTTVMTNAQWGTYGSAFDIAAGNGAGVAGNALRSVNFFDNNVYEIDLGTGAVTEVVTKAALDAAAGVSVNMVAAFEVDATGQIYALDSVSDSILSISPANTAAVEISTGDLAALAGGTSIGGIGVLGDTILIGSNSNDSLVAWNTLTNTGSTVLTTAQIDAITLSAGDANDGSVGFGDIFAAPDGLVYFYESDGDDLLSYDPNDPAGTLAIVVSEAEFLAGPSDDTPGQLAWWDGKIAYTNGSDGFYVVPEPTSLALLGLGGLLVARRRRA
ncbi:MAG: PEP-CTERM sorting domain-containing protein [Phycisphaeraceae bacterium]